MNQSVPNFIVALLVLFLTAQGSAIANTSAGQVNQLQGSAEARQDPGSERRLAMRDDVFVADTVLTAEDSTLVLALNDGSSLTLEEGSQLLVSDYVLDPEPSSLLALTHGRLRATVGRAFAGRRNSFQIRTDELVIGVQGTDFMVMASGGVSRVYVYDGLVELVSTDPAFPQPVLLRPGEFSEARAGEPVDQPRSFTGPNVAGGYGGADNDNDPRRDPRNYYPPPGAYGGNPGFDPCNELGFRPDDYLPDPRRTYIEDQIRDGRYHPGQSGPGYRTGYRSGYRGSAGGGYGYDHGYRAGSGPGYGPCNRYGTRDPIPEYYDDDPPGGYRPPPGNRPPGGKDGDGCCGDDPDNHHGRDPGHQHGPDGRDLPDYRQPDYRDPDGGKGGGKPNPFSGSTQDTRPGELNRPPGDDSRDNYYRDDDGG